MRTVCRQANGNIEIDTGLLDSHEAFGLNAPTAERFQYRKHISCAPLRTEGFKKSVTVGNESYTQYSYGANLVENNVNYTYFYRENANTTTPSSYASGPPDYTIGSRQAIFSAGKVISEYSTWAPDQTLFGNDSNYVIAFLSANQITFLESTSDSWYAATEPAGEYLSIWSHEDIQVYRQNEAASPIACAQQSQICNPNLDPDVGCTALGADTDAVGSAASLFQGSDALNRLDWFSQIIGNGATLNSVLGNLGSASLRAKKNLNYGSQGPLAPNQWQLEVQYWHAITMAALQKSFVNTAVGPSAGGLALFLLWPQTAEEEKLCHSQKIRSSAYVSFSLFGLLFVFLFGGLIIILSMSMESLVSCIQKRSKLSPYARLEWAVNSAFQLQRLAHEELQLGRWKKGANNIPVTEADAELGILDLADLKHPRLRSPAKIESASETEQGSIEQPEADAVSAVTVREGAESLTETTEERPTAEAVQATEVNG